MAEKIIEKNYKGIKHQTLMSMAQDSVDLVVASNEHHALLDEVVKKSKLKEDKEIKTEETKTPAPPTEVAERGRILTFLPTKERVTLTKAKVGQNYNEVWIHEVTNREGKKFLAAETQLKKL